HVFSALPLLRHPEQPPGRTADPKLSRTRARVERCPSLRETEAEDFRRAFDRRGVRVITWNVARRSSRLAEQAAALAAREPDVVALQEVTDGTVPLWRVVLERIGLPHVRASLDHADPSRAPARRRHTGVLLGSGAALRDPSATLPVPWSETAVAAVAATATG